MEVFKMNTEKNETTTATAFIKSITVTEVDGNNLQKTCNVTMTDGRKISLVFATWDSFTIQAYDLVGMEFSKEQKAEFEKILPIEFWEEAIVMQAVNKAHADIAKLKETLEEITSTVNSIKNTVSGYYTNLIAVCYQIQATISGAEAATMSTAYTTVNMLRNTVPKFWNARASMEHYFETDEFIEFIKAYRSNPDLPRITATIETTDYKAADFLSKDTKSIYIKFDYCDNIDHSPVHYTYLVKL
jgi:hypothetical protein